MKESGDGQKLNVYDTKTTNDQVKYKPPASYPSPTLKSVNQKAEKR